MSIWNPISWVLGGVADVAGYFVKQHELENEQIAKEKQIQNEENQAQVNLQMQYKPLYQQSSVFNAQGSSVFSDLASKQKIQSDQITAKANQAISDVFASSGSSNVFTGLILPGIVSGAEKALDTFSSNYSAGKIANPNSWSSQLLASVVNFSNSVSNPNTTIKSPGSSASAVNGILPTQNSLNGRSRFQKIESMFHNPADYFNSLGN